MDSLASQGVTILFHGQEKHAAEAAAYALRRAVPLTRNLWHVAVPAGCRIYITDSPVSFLLRSAPWYLKLPYALLIPFHLYEMYRQWQDVGGWTLPYRRWPAIAVKPPAVLATSERRIGSRIFLKQEDPTERFQHVVCHELTHAATAALKLPMWLNEGLAMVTTDRFFGRDIVQAETLDILGWSTRRKEPRSYREMARADHETIVVNYVRGYWITRFLLQVNPELVHGFLRARKSRKSINAAIAAAHQLPLPTMWANLDKMAFEYFKADR